MNRRKWKKTKPVSGVGQHPGIVNDTPTPANQQGGKHEEVSIVSASRFVDAIDDSLTLYAPVYNHFPDLPKKVVDVRIQDEREEIFSRYPNPHKERYGRNGSSNVKNDILDAKLTGPLKVRKLLTYRDEGTENALHAYKINKEAREHMFPGLGDAQGRSIDDIVQAIVDKYINQSMITNPSYKVREKYERFTSELETIDDKSVQEEYGRFLEFYLSCFNKMFTSTESPFSPDGQKLKECILHSPQSPISKVIDMFYLSLYNKSVSLASKYPEMGKDITVIFNHTTLNGGQHYMHHSLTQYAIREYYKKNNLKMKNKLPDYKSRRIPMHVSLPHPEHLFYKQRLDAVHDAVMQIVNRQKSTIGNTKTSYPTLGQRIAAQISNLFTRP